MPWQLTPASRRSGRRVGCPKVLLEVSREMRICTAARYMRQNNGGVLIAVMHTIGNI